MYGKYCVMVRLTMGNSIKKLQDYQFCVAQVVPWYFDRSQVRTITDVSVISNDLSHNSCYLRCLNN